MNLQVSLIIPVYNESSSIAQLIETISRQSYKPAEVILVDGGSTDNTVQVINDLTKAAPFIKVIEAGRAMPGKGRNIGTASAKHNWIAFTDAGIKLDDHWLENLVKKKEEDNTADIIYGAFSPQISSFFDKCAAIAYVPPLKKGRNRTKSIATCLLKKEVWEKTGGFPDWRAAEDLAFMEKAEKMGFKSIEAPEAMVYWKLQPTFASTFRKFDLYSKYNVWAGRQAHWHYGIARQYTLALVFVMLGFFHSWFWFFVIPAWIIARAIKRIWLHRQEFGANSIFNPGIVLGVAAVTLVIDAATFSGWWKAVRFKNVSSNFSILVS